MPKCLLIIDPVPINRIRLSAVFEGAHYQVTSIGSADDLARRLPMPPDLVILGMHNTYPAKDLQPIKDAGLLPETQVLCIDADAAPHRRLQALKAGARDFVSRRVSDNLLLARVRGLLREGDAERECERRRMTASSFGFAETSAPFAAPCTVACVMGQNAPESLPALLASALPHKIDLLDVQSALSDSSGPAPDAYVMAPGADIDALETLLPELRERSNSRHAPVLVIHNSEDTALAIQALNLGASDIAAESSSGEELAIRIEGMLRRKRLRDMLRQSDEQSHRLAATDPLTGLYNRRYAEAYLADLLMREEEHARGYVLMLVDLDHFKAINDTHGHSAGDEVLRQVADRLRDNLRAGDLVARYGGEEFLVVLPDANSQEGEFTAERLRKAVCRQPVLLEDGTAIPVTASIGVGFGAIEALAQPVLKTGTFDVVEPAAPLSLSRLVNAADAALYRAKSAGRNRVEFSAS